MAGVGFEVEAAKSIVGTIELAVTATGTTVADAYAIKADVTQFTTVTSGTGAIIPASLPVHSEIRIYNAGAYALSIYPPTGGYINGGAVNTAVSLPAGEGCLISRLSATKFGAAGVSDLTSTEQEYLDGVVAGTQAAGKAVIADSNVNIGATKVTALYIGTSGSETQVLATGAEINAACDVSTRLVAAGSTLSVTATSHDGKIIALDTASGSVCTLPASSGSGARFRFIVSVKPTSNAHIVKVANATDVLSGSVLSLDNDSTAETAYAATSTDDTFTMNGTTTGGLIGDWFEAVDIKAGFWAVRGMTVVPAGSNIADCFSATVS